MSKGFTPPNQLTFEKANTSDDLANCLDLTFIIGSNNRLHTKLYDKRDDFDFHIVNFRSFRAISYLALDMVFIYFPADNKICKALLLL